MPDFALHVHDDPTPEQVQEIIDSLVSYNNSKVTRAGDRKIAVTVRDENDKLVGGVWGTTHWNWLFISHLWVDERLRSQGYGRRLLNAIEHEAVERQCDAVWLDTFSFQAKPFYEELGYEQFGELPDYPPGHGRHFLWKRLP